MTSRTEVVSWLLDGDPAIRWQAMRDLTDAPAEAVAAERSRVAEEGWGADLLARQTADGHWNDETEHGWMTTTDALQLLRDLGADPADGKVRAAVGRVTERITWWQLDGRPFFDGETEACINGRILATGAYFGATVEPLLMRLLGEQLEDGGWNCEAPPSKRSSFHSTICVLEGLLEYEKARGPSAAVTDARGRAEHYLLERRMLRVAVLRRGHQSPLDELLVSARLALRRPARTRLSAPRRRQARRARRRGGGAGGAEARR